MDKSKEDILSELDNALSSIRSIQALFTQAVAHYQNGDFPAARSCAEEVLGMQPDHADANFLSGILASKEDNLERAEQFVARAVTKNPGDTRYQMTLGTIYLSQGLKNKALECYLSTLSINPEHDEARWALAMAQIPIVYGADDDPGLCRMRFSGELEKLDAWYNEERTGRGYAAVGSHLPFYLSYQEEDNRSLFSRYGALCARLMKRWRQDNNIIESFATTGQKIRIGIVTSQIMGSSVWQAFLRGWFVHLDRSVFEIHVFHVGCKRDQVTAWAQSKSSSYALGDKSLSQWVEIITARKPDLLIYPDIGLESVTTQLASLRLARVQAVAWGVPETTGLPTIDYYLSAANFEPENAQACYTEQLVLLPNLGCTYARLNVKGVEPDFRDLGFNLDAPVFLSWRAFQVCASA